MEAVRKISLKDLDQLKALYIELATGSSLEISVLPEVFEAIDKNPDYYLLGYFEDQSLLGTLMGVKCLDLALGKRPFMIVENVVVLNSARGRGIGRKLMEKIESIARDYECVFIQFCSSYFRKEAHDFYYALGYDKDAVKGFRKYFA